MPRLRELAHLLYLVTVRPALVVAAALGIILAIVLPARQPAVDIFAVAFSLLILAYASYRDIKQRTVPNKVWLLMLLVGFPFVLYYILNNGAPYIIRFAWSLGVTSILCYLFYRFHLIGGADVKALISIAAIFPTHPQFAILSQQFPIYGNTPEAFPLAMLTIFYGALLAFLVPIFLFFRNLQKLGVRAVLRNLGKAFLGYRVPLDQLATRRNVKLLYVYEENNGSVRRRFNPGGMLVDDSTLETLRRYHKQGQIPGEVWVTLDLPFLVFITCGFVISTFLGMLFSG